EPRPEIRMTIRFMVLPAIALFDNGSGAAAGAALDAADRISLFAQRFQAIASEAGVPCRDDDDESDAAVETAGHLGFGHVAGLLQPVEDGWPRPARRVDAGGEMLRKHTVRVLDEPAAGDVRHPLHLDFGEQLEHRLHVDSRRLEQCRTERLRLVLSNALREIGP